MPEVAAMLPMLRRIVFSPVRMKSVGADGAKMTGVSDWLALCYVHPVNRGLIGTIIAVLVVIILVIVILQLT